AFHCYSLKEIRLATQNFDDNLVIGKGGFGKVYKGHIYGTKDTNGRIVVAIKRLDSFSTQGASEFMTEIKMLSKLRNRHLVPLIGYCSNNNEMILVYEYMPNGTIEHHLHEAHTPLSWMDRLKISISAAKGLKYLHTGWHPQQGIIHRDVKSSNILLDVNWAAKVSDFGMSKIIREPSSGVVTNLKGTFGYLDPEYCSTGKLTKESDVYSFGVVLFELLSGRRAVDELFVEEGINLASWVKKCIKERRTDEVISSQITTQISSKCLKEFLQIADRCSKDSRKDRPTMADVVVALQHLMALQEQHDNSARATGSMGFTHKMQHLLFGSRPNPVALTPASPLCVPPSPHKFSKTPKLERTRLVHLTMKEVERATQNFSASLKLGEGGFGTVYKAQLPDGQLVAIKRAKKKHFDALRSEFRSEAELLAKIDHRNLVRLLGYVDSGNEHLIITEYIPNGTLREHLDGVHGNFLDFCQRLEICIDIAHGLTHLHLYAEKQIIHRDVKPSNILLTERFRAKVANFRYARLGDAETTQVVTRVQGTLGYLDPEYIRTYQLTPKIDVYSFGVLIIEILTGRRPIQSKRSHKEVVTLRWAFRKYKKGEIMALADPQMKEALDWEIIGKMLELAFQCAAPTRADRPDMKAAGERLWAIRMDYLRNGRIE
ncbi:probable serine/threonine-protein kinase PBL8, partial [Helianthus annuus]|uniref:probable serine/threonine-protein kinase PBL8 n=1 Tax=Helianthus annuus TaxID=4232 RepID=UPI001652BD8A